MKLSAELACAIALFAAFVWAGEAPSARVRAAKDVDWHASGSLPPGAEYHLIYEDPVTHGVETLVRMPNGYSLPPHRHSHDETMVILKGRLVLGFEGRTETVSSGGYAVIPAETVFSMRSEGFGGAQFIASFNGPFDVKLSTNTQ